MNWCDVCVYVCIHCLCCISFNKTNSLIMCVFNASVRFWQRSQCSSSAWRLSSDPRLREQVWWSLPSPSLLQQVRQLTRVKLPEQRLTVYQFNLWFLWNRKLSVILRNPIFTCQFICLSVSQISIQVQNSQTNDQLFDKEYPFCKWNLPHGRRILILVLVK